MKEILKRLQNKKILLAAVLIGLAGTLFFTGLNTVRLKRENREIKARLEQGNPTGDCKRGFSPSCDCQQ